MTNGVFSEFEVKNSAVKWHGSDETGPAERLGCVGSLDETMNTKVISKTCEGIISKQVTKGDGTGELKVKLHMRYDIFKKVFGQEFDTMKKGVLAYGRNSVHQHFTYLNEVIDEDGERKLTAYPDCVVTSGIAHKIENGANTVAEVELTIGVSPDKYGNGRYEALVKDLDDEDLKEQWLTNFTPELVRLVQV